MQIQPTCQYSLASNCGPQPCTRSRRLEYATEGLSTINGLRIIGTAREKVCVLGFVLPNRRTEEVGRLLNQGIAERAGHPCPAVAAPVWCGKYGAAFAIALEYLRRD